MNKLMLLAVALTPVLAQGLSPEFWREIQIQPASLVLFREISKVYRPSGEEEGIRRLIREIAKQARGRAWAGRKVVIKEDGKGNLLIRLPGRGEYAKGFRPVALQAHLDMVISTANAQALARIKQFGVDVVETDGWLHSRDNLTTLGADNGAGLALALRYLVDPFDDQMPLEILLTVEEENGMHGAKELGHTLTAGCLINLDWDNAGIIGHACTGSERVAVGGLLDSYGITFHPGDVVIDVTLRNLPGGHSGVDINDRPPNAAIFAASILRHALTGPPTWLHSFESGEMGKLNTIPSEAHARLVTSAAEAPELTARLKRAFATSPHRIRAARFDVDQFSIDEAYHTGRLSEGDYGYVPAEHAPDDHLAAIEGLPNGPLTPRAGFPGWETSSSLGFAQVYNGHLDLGVMVRSFDEKDAQRQGDELRAYLGGFKFLDTSRMASTFNPGWTTDTNTFLYRAGSAADSNYRLSVAPGGLELVPLSKKIGPIPATSIGPNIRNLHAVTERMERNSLFATQDFLDKYIARLGDCAEMLLAR